MAYSYRWQYCDMDFLRHCLKKYSLLLEKIPSAILTEETTGTQMFVTEFLSDCIKRCDDGFDDYTMTHFAGRGSHCHAARKQGYSSPSFHPLSRRICGTAAENGSLLLFQSRQTAAAGYGTGSGKTLFRIFRLCVQQNVGSAVSPARFSLGGRRNSFCQPFENALRRCRSDRGTGAIPTGRI